MNQFPQLTFFFQNLFIIFVGIEAEELNAGGIGHTFPLVLFEVSVVAVDVFMVFVSKLLFLRCLRPLRRTCCTGWTLQCGYDELSNAISRAVEVKSHGVSSSMITSLGKMSLLMIGLVVGSAVFFGLLWEEWKQNPSQRSWFLFGGAFYIVSAMKFLWSHLWAAFRQSFVLQISVDRCSSSTLLKRYADDLFHYVFL